MDMIRGALITVVATTALALGMSRLTEVDTLTGEVNDESIVPIVKNMTDDGAALNSLLKTRLIIHSPGGSVSDMELLLQIMKTNKRYVQTEIPVFAASAAADVFLAGNKRLMAKNAEILFHEVRIMLGDPFSGMLMITYTDLKSFAETGKLADNSEHLKRGSEKQAIESLKEIPLEIIKKMVEHMTKLHEKHIEFVMERTGLTKEEVISKILIPNVDVTFGLEEALKLNIATGEI